MQTIPISGVFRRNMSRTDRQCSEFGARHHRCHSYTPTEEHFQCALKPVKGYLCWLPIRESGSDNGIGQRSPLRPRGAALARTTMFQFERALRIATEFAPVNDNQATSKGAATSNNCEFKCARSRSIPLHVHGDCDISVRNNVKVHVVHCLTVE